MFDKLDRIKAFRLVFLGNEADILDIDLRPVALTFLIGATNLVSSAFLPFFFANLKPGTVCPNHAGGRPFGIAKAAGEKRLAFPGCSFGPFGQERKKISELTRCQLADFTQGWLGWSH